MRLGSLFMSGLLHGGLLLALFLWPTSPPLRLDQPMIQISMTMGAPGGDRMPSPVLGPQGSPDLARRDSRPAPAPAKSESAASLPAPQDTAKPEPQEVTAKAQPESVPTPKPIPKPESEAVPISEKKVPEPPKEPEKKPEPKEPPKPEKAPEPAKKAEPEKKAEPAKKAEPDKKSEPAKQPSPNAVAAALADARKSAGRTSPTRSSGSTVAGALADMERTSRRSGGAGGGGGGEGEGEGGGGVYNVYAGQVILAVRPNWQMPTYSRDVFVAQVWVKIDASGNVLDCGIERSSGRADFDASAVNAIIRTKTLPAPPSPDLQNMVLTFNSLEMAGG